LSDVIDIEIDRFSELANIGAGHAAGAFSQLTGHTIVIDPPRVFAGDGLCGERLVADEDKTHAVEGDEPWNSGVIFEFDGCIGAVVAILFRRSMCDAVVQQLMGQGHGNQPPEVVESVLAEVGNILASHVASAIADTLNARLLPSIPTISLDHAEEHLETLAVHREHAGGLRVECELRDLEGELGGLVVLIPDAAEG
jgi:chemotaxis protein CheC